MAFWTRTKKEMIMILGPLFAVLIALTVLVYIYIDPAPPKHFVISTGEENGNYYQFGQAYREQIHAEGIDLQVLPSKGAWDNLSRLADPKSHVDVAFVQDGLGTRKKNPGMTSLGSVFYEPIWVFYRGNKKINRFTQFKGQKIAVGEKGGETHTMAKKLLEASGVTDKNSTFLEVDTAGEVEALHSGAVQAAFLMGPPENKLINDLLKDPTLHLMSTDQAEAITRQIPYLHHLVLPHGTIDLERDIPAEDVDLVAPTATLIVRSDLHPALVYLLLKAASHVHRQPGVFEKRHEFPTDKDYVFPLNTGAKNYYQSGAPFWLRYLPFWLATIVERFIFLIIPMAALIIPILRSIPRMMKWRVRNRIYQRYGELKFLESKIRENSSSDKYQDYLGQLDKIEERVNQMRIPLEFSDYVYSLRGHIQFVRDRLLALLKTEGL